MHPESARFAEIFHAGYLGKMLAISGQDLTKYPEHRNTRFQADLVSRFRTAIRMNIARAYASDARGRKVRAERAAYLAGGYWAEYRKHFRHLLTLVTP